MSQLNANAVERKAFDTLIERLSLEVDAAKTNSNDFYSKASRLVVFTLNCDSEKSAEKPPLPEGLLTILDELINRLQYVNRRNLEMLQQIDKLI